MSDQSELDEILTNIIIDTGAKLTEIGWEKWGENVEDAKAALTKWRDDAVATQNLALLTRLQQEQYGMYDDYHDLVNIVPMSAIQAERAKLKEEKWYE
jgi:hypothetical protein